jgi:hypothetical protein
MKKEFQVFGIAVTLAIFFVPAGRGRLPGHGQRTPDKITGLRQRRRAIPRAVAGGESETTAKAENTGKI